MVNLNNTNKIISINYKKFKGEIMHYYNSQNKDCIQSKGNSFFGRIGENKFKFKIKINKIQNLLIKFRILRRLFRLDKSNAILNYKKNGIIIKEYTNLQDEN